MTGSVDRVLTLSQDATLRAVSREGVILMVTTGKIYSCNDTAIDALSRMDGTVTQNQIVSDMAAEYAVDPLQLKADIAELFDYLRVEGVVVEVV